MVLLGLFLELCGASAVRLRAGPAGLHRGIPSDRSLIRNSQSSFGDYIAVRYPLGAKNKFATVVIKPPRGSLQGAIWPCFQITLDKLVQYTSSFITSYIESGIVLV